MAAGLDFRQRWPWLLSAVAFVEEQLQLVLGKIVAVLNGFSLKRSVRNGAIGVVSPANYNTPESDCYWRRSGSGGQGCGALNAGVKHNPTQCIWTFSYEHFKASQQTIGRSIGNSWFSDFVAISRSQSNCDGKRVKSF